VSSAISPPRQRGANSNFSLLALITLTEATSCSQVVIGIARAMTDEQVKSLTKGLGWAGFSLTTLDFWTDGGVDVTSDKWLLMGLEV